MSDRNVYRLALGAWVFLATVAAIWVPIIVFQFAGVPS